MLKRNNGELVWRREEQIGKYLGKRNKAYPSSAGSELREWAFTDDAEIETFRVFWDRLVKSRSHDSEMIWVQCGTTDEDGRAISNNKPYEIDQLIQEFAVQPKLIYFGDTTCFIRFKRDYEDWYQYWITYANTDIYEYYMQMREVQQPEMLDICLFFEGVS